MGQRNLQNPINQLPLNPKSIESNKNFKIIQLLQQKLENFTPISQNNQNYTSTATKNRTFTPIN